MTRTSDLLLLCDLVCKAENITHWAVSNRIFGSSDFFDRLTKKTPGGKPVTCGVVRFERALDWFHENWPEGVVWPDHIQRPDNKERAA